MVSRSGGSDMTSDVLRATWPRTVLPLSTLAYGHVRTDQADETELARLRGGMRACCRRHGLSLIQVCVDQGSSGTDIARMGLGDVLDLVEQAEDSVLVVPELTHLAMDGQLLSAILLGLHRQGRRLLVMGEDSTPGTAL